MPRESWKVRQYLGGVKRGLLNRFDRIFRSHPSAIPATPAVPIDLDANPAPNTENGPDSPRTTIDYLEQIPGTKRFQELVAWINERKDISVLASIDEMATLAFLIRRLRPKMVLEVGTFFASTSKVMVEALHDVRYGKLTTLDPFGGARVPGIIQKWAAPLQQRVDFRPLSSMDYFLELETKSFPTGIDSPLKLAFIDGHHNLEYALFDLVRTADHLAPGGVISVDNMELDGPRQAAVEFLHWNPAWTLLTKGKRFDSSVRDDELAALLKPPAEWGILLSPEGVQIASRVKRFLKRNATYQPINGIRANLRAAPMTGEWIARLNYFAIPYDFHVTGQGMVRAVGVARAVCSEGATTLAVNFDTPMHLSLPATPMNVCYELELLFRAHHGENGYLELDATTPFEFF